jgi:DNA processing protein
MRLRKSACTGLPGVCYSQLGFRMASPATGQEALLYWLALHLVPGLGSGNAVKLIRKLGSPERVFHASVSELEACGARPGVAQSIVSGVSFEDAAAEADRVRAAGAQIITLHDPSYPPLLKEIYDPPILLYARGCAGLLSAHQIAVVGSRRPSPYGTAVANKLSGELAEAGLAIVSGMARGIDTAAHHGALRAGGGTIAVLGCGVDVVYPAENKKLAAEIAARGLLVSEFPMGSVAFPQNFPIRNRIISGLSAGVMVVEAAQYSGSLITARLALDHGREVFAIPGNIVSRLSWGPNLLIKQGAMLVQEWKDVVEALPDPIRSAIFRAQQAKMQQQLLEGLADTAGAESLAEPVASDGKAGQSAGPGLAPLEKRLLQLLQVDVSTHIDALIGELETEPPSGIIAALCELELAGHVRQLPGKSYVRVW